jgi:hypothetical protein
MPAVYDDLLRSPGFGFHDDVAAMMAELQMALVNRACDGIKGKRRRREARLAVGRAFDLLWADRLLVEPAAEDQAHFRARASRQRREVLSLCGPLRYRQFSDPALVDWPSKRSKPGATLTFGLKG